MNLRSLAKGQPCQVRLYGICNFNPDTTVLCHLRRGGIAGVGQKPPDLCGVWACSACHDAIDGRTSAGAKRHDSDVLDGLCRTLFLVSEELGL